MFTDPCRVRKLDTVSMEGYRRMEDWRRKCVTPAVHGHCGAADVPDRSAENGETGCVKHFDKDITRQAAPRMYPRHTAGVYSSVSGPVSDWDE